MQVSFTEDKIVFVDDKGRAESLEMFESMSEVDSIRAIATEQKAAGSASKGAVSLLATMLNSPRLDGWKGVVPLNEAVPSELKAALREIETEYLKPIFVKYHTDKGAKESTVEKLWQEYSGALKAGGSYAVAKSEATKYFAYCGKTPMCTNGKLLSVAAIKKLVLDAKSKATKEEDSGIAGKIVALSLDLRKENSKEGDAPTAIAALKAMLVFYEALQAENGEAAQAAAVYKPVNIADATKAILDKATAPKHARHAVMQQAATH